MTHSLLFICTRANMQLTSDQPFTKVYANTNWFPTYIIGRQRSGACSIACAGGIYDGVGKTGNLIVAATQSWLTLAVGIIVTATLAGLVQTTLLGAPPIMSLTTGSTAACTADILIYGFNVP